MNQEEKTAAPENDAKTHRLRRRASSALSYLAALVVCFFLGCGIVFVLRAYDRYMNAITPLEEGERLDLSAYGFSLIIPNGCTLIPYDSNDDVRFAGSLSDQSLYLFCYDNAYGDQIDDYTDQELVSFAVQAGYKDVRMRTLGGQRFICYSEKFLQDSGTLHSYETWNAQWRLIIETPVSAREILPVLLTLQFEQPAADE